jgi:hypothetical protein
MNDSGHLMASYSSFCACFTTQALFIVNLQLAVCRVHFRFAHAASQFDRPATSPITLQTRGLSSYRVLDCGLMMDCGGCGMWLAMPRAGGPWNLACLLGGPWKGNCFASAIPMGGEGHLNISVLVFISKWVSLFRYRYSYRLRFYHHIAFCEIWGSRSA